MAHLKSKELIKRREMHEKREIFKEVVRIRIPWKKCKGSGRQSLRKSIIKGVQKKPNG